ncbi:MAG: class I SAM-dependent methyltransferase [Proteobacteria bacterium]|nr:class I SAM-dependent methyltransferase [Pseudomonadota bacterium]
MKLRQPIDYDVLEENLSREIQPKTPSQIMGLEKTLVDLCCSFIVQYFESCGIVFDDKKSMTFQEFCLILDVQEKYYRFVRRLLEILSLKEVVKCKADSIVFSNTNHLLSAKRIIEGARGLLPDFIPFFSFLEHCAAAYRDVLKGEKIATEILFPVDNPMLIKQVHSITPKIGFENFSLQFSREIFTDFIGRNKFASVIEIGGGQGILTDLLLPTITSSTVEYCFTDIGESFVKEQLAKKSKYFPNFSGKVLDITMDPKEQGFSNASFDFLIGFNVVHATPNIPTSIKEISKLVKPGGMLCLVEDVQPLPWIDMIYGLTEDWWSFNDSYRNHSPLASIDQWNQILNEMGYQNNQVYPKNFSQSQVDTAVIIIEI